MTRTQEDRKNNGKKQMKRARATEEDLRKEVNNKAIKQIIIQYIMKLTKKVRKDKKKPP